MKRAESSYLMATDQRNELADLLFEPASVAATIHDAASLGFRNCRITQDAPFDLSDTEAAKALEEWLDREQFHYMWRPTFLVQDPFRPSIVTEYPELVITW